MKKVTAPFPSKKCLSPLKIKERGTFYGIIFLHMKIHQRQYSPKQGRLPVFIADLLDICDPVLTFDQIMEEIGIEQYLKPDSNPWHLGRPRFNRVNMLKTVLFGFMDMGYASVREMEKQCKVNIRYMYLMDYAQPSYRAFSYFINEEIEGRIEEISRAIMEYIIEKDHVDLEHLYIDGSKFEANANKYTWVWKKATEKSRYRLYEKINRELTAINEELECIGFKVEMNTEYTPESLELILEGYSRAGNVDPTTFRHGKGQRKTDVQRHYETLTSYLRKLKQYVQQIKICGPDRNSYSKTDQDATFMRVKKDYMGNDQLLPAYNIQIGVADEYIVVADVMQYRSDMDCFVPLIEKFHDTYGFYPRYPVADAGYGSYNNYLYCQEHGMEKYMKFPMYKKETTDEKYHNDPFRAVNFRRDFDGNLICPNGKKFCFAYREPVKGNHYGRQEEIYQCEDCSGCPYAEQCKKTVKNRTIRLNEELTSLHQEVVNNLESIHGALLRMNRSIQAEGSFGIMKYDRWYKRIVRKGLRGVKLELLLVVLGHNLYKYHNRKLKKADAA